MKSSWKKVLCAAMSGLLLVSFAGCANQMSSIDLMKDVKGSFNAEDVQGGTGNVGTGNAGSEDGGAGNVGTGTSGSVFDNIQYRFEDGALAVTDFGVELMKECYGADTNTLISPLSVISALGMTANGARGETLVQMLETFGITLANLREYIRDYQAALPNDKKYQLNMANAIWFKDTENFTVEEEFLQINRDYFDAGVYRAPFDESTRLDINQWVEENTNGMIKDVLDKISDEAVMYLVNALAFEAEWEEIYNENQIWNREFTKEDGTAQKTEFMHSDERMYLEDESAVGFMKYYADKSYAFVALLPKEGITVEEYLANLTGVELHQLLTNPTDVHVDAAIPKFKTGYNVQMKDVLTAMGIQDAFDSGLADFSGLGHSTEGNIYIERVIHKTFIEVDAKGTKAGAATVVEMSVESAMEMPESKTVILDRPFVYMIIDCEENVPVFIGTMMDVTK